MGGYKFKYVFIIFALHIVAISHAQEVEVLKSNQLFERIEKCNENDIEVFNFWATWCAPCIRELPQFDKINDQFSNVHVNLVSIDDVDLLEKKVKPFIVKRNVTSDVMLLDETDFNALINGIDESWSGAIPATLVVDCKNNKKYFFEKEFKDQELETIIQEIINQL